MSFAKIASTYLVITVVFFAIDMLWLGVVAKGFYRNQLGPILSEQVNWPAAIAFYLLFIAGILLFVVFPALDKGSLGRAVVVGALFGLVTYATYDLTNLATNASIMNLSTMVHRYFICESSFPLVSIIEIELVVTM